MSDRLKRAEEIVENSAGWAAVTGVLPMPVLDTAALMVINVRMLERLAELYETPFSRVRAETYLAALFGSLTTGGLKRLAFKAGALFIPGLGPLLGLASLAASGASITYGVGRVFIHQFESGGSFLAFDPAKAAITEKSGAGAPAKEAPEPAAASDSPVTDSPIPGPERAAQIAEPSDSPVTDSPIPVLDRSVPAASALPVAATQPDDLTIVIGIGPKIADLLAAAGITTFAALAATKVATLQAILDSAGPRYAVHDPASWPEQGRLAAEGKLDMEPAGRGPGK